MQFMSLMDFSLMDFSALAKDTKSMPINVVHNKMIYLTENSDWNKRYSKSAEKDGDVSVNKLACSPWK